MSVPDRSDKLVVKPEDGTARDVAHRILMRGHERGYLTSHSMHEMVALVDRVFAPEPPAVQPWTFETAPVERMKVRSKDGGALMVAVVFPEGFGVFGTFFNDEGRLFTFAEFADQFEQLDGTPCGIVQSSEWPKWFTWVPGNGSHVWRMDSEGRGELFLGGVSFGTCRTATDLANDPSGEYAQITAAEAEALIEKARAK